MGDFKRAFKSKYVKKADFIHYNGKCYYRTGKVSRDPYINETPQYPITRYYIPTCATLRPSLTSLALCAHSCSSGQRLATPNKVLEVDPYNNWFQFIVKQDIGERTTIKFNRWDGTYFIKSLLYKDKDKIIFDEYGPDEKTFRPDAFPENITFNEADVSYCISYVASGSHIFTMHVYPDPSVYSPFTPTPTVSYAALPATPTPTPTREAPTVECDGINFCRNSVWPTSGDNSISFWFDAADHTSLRTTQQSHILPMDGDLVVEWVDKSGKGRHAKQVDTLDYAPRYVESGKVGGGPGIKFTQDFRKGSDYLSWDSGAQRVDIRAVFVVATTDNLRGNGEQGLITANSKDGGAMTAYGNILTLEGMRNFWSGVKIGTEVRQSIFSDTYSGGDGGQLYMNGHVVPDNHPVVGPGTSTYVDGAIYGGTRHPSTRDLNLDGLCIGAKNKLNAGFGVGWNGEINEVIVLDKTPSEQFRQEIEGYLAWKWGLVDWLPEDHPCKKGVCVFPTPTPTVEPTPPPATPEVTPVWPRPSGPPEGASTVTMTQLWDSLTQRNRPATLWLGGMYESDWELTNNRLDAITNSNSIFDFIAESNKHIGRTFSVNNKVLVPEDSWRTGYYEHNQPTIKCPGTENQTLRVGWNDEFADNIDTQLLYCLGKIAPATSGASSTLYDMFSYDDWYSFSNAIKSTGGNIYDLASMRRFEESFKTPLSIESFGYSYSEVDLYLPLSTLYRLDGDITNPSPLGTTFPPALHIGNYATRADIAAHLMYHHEGLAFWQVPVVFDNRYEVQISVRLPGAKDDMTGWNNLIGVLPWEVQVEIFDKHTGYGEQERVKVVLPVDVPSYIPATIPTMKINKIPGYTFSVTPYAGDWRASSTDDIIAKSRRHDLPVLFFRIDRELA